jgi:hypothetical protein
LPRLPFVRIFCSFMQSKHSKNSSREYVVRADRNVQCSPFSI